MKAYVRYGSNDTIISGVLVKSNKKPSGYGWVEVPITLCCSVLPGTAPSNPQAYIKYAGNMVVPGSTIIRKKKPKSGKWVQVPLKRCCNGSTFVPNIEITPSILQGEVGDNITFEATVNGQPIDFMANVVDVNGVFTLAEVNGVWSVTLIAAGEGSILVYDENNIQNFKVVSVIATE